MSVTVRTRFAPSPTGRLHLGNVRAAAFNWLLARHHGGAFVLRLEDTDADRNVPGSEEAIYEDLRWLGLDWDEGPDIGGPHAPYKQSERAAKYERGAAKLLDAGRAYPCFCTEAELAGEAEVVGEGRTALRYSGRCRRLSAAERERRLASGEPHVIRFAVPEELTVAEVEDEVFGSISVPASDIEDFVLCRSDGRPTYNFAVVVDDVDMAITHVVRGVGHLSNTAKQALLFDALSVARPVFAHLPTVLGPEGRKLSKREGATAVASLRAEGFPPDAVLNYLSLLGWSHPEEREVLGRAELVEAISLGRVGRSDTRMDPEKLRWVSSQHLAAEDSATLAAHVLPFIDADRFPAALDRPEAVVGALRSRLSTYGDVNEHLSLLFPDEAAAAVGRAMASEGAARGVLGAVRARLGDVEEWTAEALDRMVREAGRDAGARGAELFHPVRAALIGSESGPDLGKILAAIGRSEALRRMDEALGKR